MSNVLTTANSFDSFNIFELGDFLLTAALFQHLVGHEIWHCF